MWLIVHSTFAIHAHFFPQRHDTCSSYFLGRSLRRLAGKQVDFPWHLSNTFCVEKKFASWAPDNSSIFQKSRNFLWISDRKICFKFSSTVLKLSNGDGLCVVQSTENVLKASFDPLPSIRQECFCGRRNLFSLDFFFHSIWKGRPLMHVTNRIQSFF